MPKLIWGCGMARRKGRFLKRKYKAAERIDKAIAMLFHQLTATK